MKKPPATRTQPKIGVFDSGIGGLSIVAAIKKELPDTEIIFRQDEKHFPYGTRTPGKILRYVEPILEDMVHEGCQVIVIACNTVATTLINQLRHLIRVPLIGIQPMLGDAARLTKTGTIAVCATPTVYASPVYQQIKARHTTGLKVIEVETRDWPYMADHDIMDDIKIANRIEAALLGGADVIVLACTHYGWINNKVHFIAASHHVNVVEPASVTVEWLEEVLKTLA